jgi:hypothetical protein
MTRKVYLRSKEENFIPYTGKFLFPGKKGEKESFFFIEQSRTGISIHFDY